MKKNYRRALFFAATFIFMATTPVVILYALGYRTTLTGADPLPVGVLLIETEPAQAKIYIDGESVGQSPRSISRPTGIVNVRIEKEGYTTWEKNLNIEPGRATEVRDVRLFPANRLHTTLAEKILSFSLSPSRRLTAVQHDSLRLEVLDQTGEVVLPSQPFSQPIDEYVWSPNSDALLLHANESASWWYVSITGEGRIVPLALPGVSSREVVWDPRIPERLIWLDTTGTLRATTIEPAASVVLTSEVSHFATSASHIYAVVGDEKNLREYSLQGQPSGTNVPLPTGVVSELLVTPQENIVLRLESGEVWLLQNEREFVQVASGISFVDWSPSGKTLLLKSDTSSLYVYNVNDKRTTLPLKELRLVQRLSRPIVEPHWFAGGRHVVYQAGDALWITEIDTRDHPISFEIDTTNLGSAAAAVGEEGETIFYLKRVNGVTNLISTKLLAQ